MGKILERDGEQMTVKTSFLGKPLANPLMNASGVHCMTVA